MTTDPRALLDEYASEDRPYTVIARISGRVDTAFPDGRSAAGGLRGRGHQRDGRRGRRGERDGIEAAASVGVDRGRPDHRRRGRRHARGPVLGRGAGVPRQPYRDPERRQRHAGHQRPRQPHRLGRPHQRAQPRHVHAAVYPRGGAPAAGRARLSREGAGADRAARGDRAPAGGAGGEQLRATTP